jgi:hypothetical protein
MYTKATQYDEPVFRAGLCQDDTQHERSFGSEHDLLELSVPICDVRRDNG